MADQVPPNDPATPSPTPTPRPDADTRDRSYTGWIIGIILLVLFIILIWWWAAGTGADVAEEPVAPIPAEEGVGLEDEGVVVE